MKITDFNSHLKDLQEGYQTPKYREIVASMLANEPDRAISVAERFAMNVVLNDNGFKTSHLPPCDGIGASEQVTLITYYRAYYRAKFTSA